MQAGALVGAMLTPHDAEDAQLGIARLAAQNGYDLPVFGFGELVLGDQVRGDGHAAHTAAGCEAATRERKMTRPSLEPINGSAARSGCGINPSTLRPALRTAAMSRCEPLGVST